MPPAEAGPHQETISMAAFKWFEMGMNLIVVTELLADGMSDSAWKMVPVTNDPLTFDWNAVDGDMTRATFTGGGPQAISALNVGPFQDATNQEIFYKVVGLTYTNTGAGPESITGLYLFVDGTPDTPLGVLIFDDAIVVNVGVSVIVNVPIGIGQGTQESEVEVVLAA